VVLSRQRIRTNEFGIEWSLVAQERPRPVLEMLLLVSQASEFSLALGDSELFFLVGLRGPSPPGEESRRG
jgi:hypothetical protein